jgi:hypothetical protein
MPVAAAAEERIKEAQAFDGRQLLYPGDAWLDEPEVYYSPELPNQRFKVYEDDRIETDHTPGRPRQKLHFQPEAFANGRYVAHTVLTRAAVRRVLGGNADRWKGDDLPKQRTCPQESCRFATGNEAAWDDHEKYTGRHAPMPDIDAYYRLGRW